jgi:DNA repair protein RadD
VRSVSYSVHTKRGAELDAPRTLRVEYQTGYTEWRSEWVCFEHAGWARKKAELWWKHRSNALVPQTAEEAVRLAEAGALSETRSITVRSVAGEKYDTIIGYELGEKPSWREPGWEDEETTPLPAWVNPEEVPF